MTQQLLNHLWQSTLFAGVIGLLTLALRSNSARLRYWLWLGASVKFLIPFSLLVSLGSHFGWREAAPPSPAAAIVQQISQPFPPAVTVSPDASPQEPRRRTNALLIIWACGFAVVVLYWGRRWTRMNADMRTAAPLDLSLPIPAKSSRSLREPGVFGLFRPVLLLPEGITERLTPEQLQAILAHELCHVRRRDNLWAATHMVIEAVFWFHPLVWWIGARLVTERERACDEEVLRQGSDPQAYAEGILNVCKFYVESPLECVAGVTGSNLKKRIEDIMSGCTSRKLDFARKALLAIAAIGAVAGPIAIGLLNAPRSFAQTNTSQYTFGLTTVADRSFDVATVKPGPPDSTAWQLGVPTRGRITIENMELRKIIASSFRIQDSMVIGPNWLDSARYSIVGKGADPTVGNPVVWENMRNLLATRFQLKYHVEARERPVYALVIAKGGHKLKRPEDGPCAEPIKRGEHCANLRFSPVNVGITNMPAQALIGGLGRIMPDRPIIDGTGLTGFYDVDVKWVPADFKPTEEGTGGQQLRLDVSAMLTALQEQAGLKLEAQTGPVDFLVIDHVEKPSEN